MKRSLMARMVTPWMVMLACLSGPLRSQAADGQDAVAVQTVTIPAAEIRLVTVANPAPAGKRFIDFVMLNTEPGDTCQSFKPDQVASCFTLEAARDAAGKEPAGAVKLPNGEALSLLAISLDGHGNEPAYRSSAAWLPPRMFHFSADLGPKFVLVAASPNPRTR